MSAPDIAWAVGRPTMGGAAALASSLKVYGKDRVPPTGGCVVASNHFSWLDPVVLGRASPRVLYYMAKMEAHRIPGLGTFSSRVVIYEGRYAGTWQHGDVGGHLFGVLKRDEEKPTEKPDEKK